MNCLYPRPFLVKSAFAEQSQQRGQDKFWRDRYGINRPYSYTATVLPCGKCVNCLKNRQNQLVVRVQEEAKAKGNVCFVTLTYDPQHIPLAQSFWVTDKDTGEQFLWELPHILASARDEETYYREKLNGMPGSPKPKYIDTPLDEEFQSFLRCTGELPENYELFSRVTPSVCREDVRLWLKRCRVRYEREHGFKLSSFTYLMVQEYGFHTCRPHSHLLFFGLTRLEVAWLCKQWEYGFTRMDYVHQINENGKNGYALVARYISKYMTKGKFECESVTNRSAEKPRICMSHGLGSHILDKVAPYVYAYDIFGKYDLDTLKLDDGSQLSEAQINVLCQQIPRRLSYSPDGKYRYPLPRVFINKLFKEYITFKDEKTDKVRAFYRPFKIWSLVADYLRKLNDDLYQAQLRQFLASNSSRSLRQGMVAFAVYRDASYEVANDLGEKKVLEQYQKSVF